MTAIEENMHNMGTTFYWNVEAVSQRLDRTKNRVHRKLDSKQYVNIFARVAERFRN